MAVEGILVTPRDWRIMQAHVQACLPEEACGLLAGREGIVQQVYCIPNVLHSPVRYRMEPRAQVGALHAIKERGLELLGIFHSHPGGPAIPSTTDIAEAAYPACAWLIWSPGIHAAWQCRAYRITEERFHAVPLYLQLPGGARVIASEIHWQGGSR